LLQTLIQREGQRRAPADATLEADEGIQIEA